MKRLTLGLALLLASGCRDEGDDTYVVKKTYHEVVDVLVVNEQVVEVIVQCDCPPKKDDDDKKQCKLKKLKRGDHVRCEGKED